MQKNNTLNLILHQKQSVNKSFQFMQLQRMKRITDLEQTASN